VSRGVEARPAPVVFEDGCAIGRLVSGCEMWMEYYGDLAPPNWPSCRWKTPRRNKE
jgi:hypothetical protein